MKKLLLAALCIGALCVSCNDDDERIDFVDKNYGAKQFIEDTRSSIKEVNKLNTADLPKTITLEGGVTIEIPQDAFTKGGTPITGEFTVESYVVLKPSNAIFSGTNTNYSGGRILESDGYIYLDVKQNGVSVDQNTNSLLSVSIPTNKEAGTVTELWIGDENSGQGEDQFAWNDFNQEVANWDQGRWVEAGKDGKFSFLLGKLGWINCDIFWGEDKEMTTLTAKLSGEVGKLASFMGYEGDTFVFFCAKNAFALAQLYTVVDNTTVKSYDDSMPIGLEGKLVAFSIKEGIFSYAAKDITIEKDMVVDLKLEKVTKETLQQNIKALDTYK